MNPNTLTLIESLAGLKVLVIGEAMLDSYLKGSSERICREAPVPVVSITDREHVPGGAANTAVNVHTLGGQVIFLSVIGEDTEGNLLRKVLADYGVPTDNLIVTAKRATLAKQRVIASHQMVVRFDQGSTEVLDPQTEAILIERLDQLFPECDALIISDYDYGILTPHVIKRIAELQEANPRVVVVDSKRLPDYRNINITAIKPNYGEAVSLLGVEKVRGTGERVVQIAAHGDQILDLTGAQIAAVTLDQEGALIFERDHLPYRTYAKPAPHTRSAGAGDTFISALTLSLAAGASTENAVEIASAAASIVVGKDGTSACYADELNSYFSTDEKYITDVFQLAARIAAYRRENLRIVFTNGCFDILHRGHINYLNRAKSFGDVLIVGMNTDDSVRRLKGPSRPINNLEDRAQILAALSCVDHIVPFEGDTPHELIKVIQPDVFVKGGDYTRETLPEASLVEELGGVLQILPYLEDHSTTSIIERIQQKQTNTAMNRPAEVQQYKNSLLNRETKPGEGDQ